MWMVLRLSLSIRFEFKPMIDPVKWNLFMTSLLVFMYVALGTWTQSVSKSIDFPYRTLAVNLIDCLVIGFLSQLAEARGVFTSESRVYVFIGLPGGFTTFSSFINNTINLFRDGKTFNVLANIGANVIFGLILVWMGRTVAYWLWR